MIPDEAVEVARLRALIRSVFQREIEWAASTGAPGVFVEWLESIRDEVCGDSQAALAKLGAIP